MKFIAALATFAGLAMAQNAAIGLPKEHTELKAGSKTVVQIERPNSLTPSTEFGIAIGISTRDESASDFFGTVLHSGPFKPVYHETYLPPYQNFTVTIPSDTAKGNALITIAHANLIGAGQYPSLEVLNRTVTIV